MAANTQKLRKIVLRANQLVAEFGDEGYNSMMLQEIDQAYRNLDSILATRRSNKRLIEQAKEG